jgi:ABC-2 type transport system permease protein
VDSIRRVVALWRLYTYLDVVWVLRDFRAAIGYYVSEIVAGVGAVLATLLLAERFAGLGEWSRDQVIFMLGYSILASGFLDLFFSYNVKFISRRIGRGQLDHTLVQPHPVWVTLLTEGFVPVSGSPMLVPGIALLVWSGGQIALPTSPIWWLAFAANLVASGAIVLAFSYLWGSLAFWAPRAAEEVSSSALRLIDQLKGFPLDGMSAGARAGLLTAVPTGLVAWLPSRTLLGVGGADPLALWLTPLAAIAFAALAGLAFRAGLGEYRRTGSRRYTSFGHRR